MAGTTRSHGRRDGGRAALAAAVVLVGATLTAPASAQQAPAITPVPAYAVAVASDPAAQRAAPAIQQAGFQALATTAPFVLVPAASAVAAPSRAIVRTAAAGKTRFISSILDSKCRGNSSACQKGPLVSA